MIFADLAVFGQFTDLKSELSPDLDFENLQTIPFLDTTKSGLSSCGIYFF